ncbi:MAG: FtsX-like permease family protein [Gaiellales bacterium]
MRPVVALGARLAWAAPGQRLRSGLVLLAAAIGTLMLVTVGAIAAAEQASVPGLYQASEMRRLLAAVVAAIALPTLTLAATAGRLSASIRDRRLANLRLLGLSPLQTRAVAAVEAGTAASVGAVLGWAVFWLARPLLASVHVAGRSWRADDLAPSTAWQLLAVCAVPLTIMALAALPQRLDMRTSLTRSRRADTKRPSPWRALPLAIGLGLCLLVYRADPTKGIGDSTVVALFAAIGLIGIGIIAVVPVFVRLLADLILKVFSGPTAMVTARRLQAQPASMNRVVSALVIGLFLVVGARAVVVNFESTPQYRAAAAQLLDEQRNTVTVPARTAKRVAASALLVDGVRTVTTIPILHGRCGPTRWDHCTAIVATCAQLAGFAPGLQGCVEGRPVVLLRSWEPSKNRLTLWAVQQGQRLETELTLPLPRHELSGEGLPDNNPAQPIEPLHASILLPPRTPGINDLVARTDRTLLLTADPGRDLRDHLLAAGIQPDSGADWESYDFVASLRSLVWALAAVILSLGLLAFGVAAIDRAVARRREVASLQLAGVPPSLLRRAQWLEAALPTTLGCLLATVAGLLAGATFLQLDSAALPPPWQQAATLGAIGIVASFAIAALTVIAASPRISPELIRSE